MVLLRSYGDYLFIDLYFKLTRVYLLKQRYTHKTRMIGVSSTAEGILSLHISDYILLKTYYTHFKEAEHIALNRSFSLYVCRSIYRSNGFRSITRGSVDPYASDFIDWSS